MDFNTASLYFPTQSLMPPLYPLLDLPLNPSPFYYNNDLLLSYLIANKENLLPKAPYYLTAADDLYHAEQPFKKQKLAVDNLPLGMLDNFAAVNSLAQYRRNSDYTETTCSNSPTTIYSMNPYNFPMMNQTPLYNTNFQEWSSPLPIPSMNSSQNVDIPLLMPENQDCREELKKVVEEKRSPKQVSPNGSPVEKLMVKLNKEEKVKYLEIQDEARKKNVKSHLQKKLEAMIMGNSGLVDKVNKNNQRVIPKEVSSLFQKKDTAKYVIQPFQNAQDIQALVNKKEKLKVEEIEETASPQKQVIEPVKTKKEHKKK